MSASPSGRSIVLQRGSLRAEVVEVGAALRSLQAGGRELLDGFAADERSTDARGQTLMPWPNRLADGRYGWAGEEHLVPLTEPPNGCAIHGLARWARWEVTASDGARATLTHVLPPQSGWPFALELRVTYALGADGLTVTPAATNLGDGPAPWAAGAHPYLRAPGGGTIDDAVLRAPGSIVLEADDRGIPTGVRRPVAGTPEDLRTPRRVGSLELDTAYTDLERDADGRARVRLTDESGTGAELWLGPNCGYLMLFTGDGLPDPARRRRGLGVEPMTAAPNALASGDGLVVLAPGASAEATWGIAPVERPAP